MKHIKCKWFSSLSCPSPKSATFRPEIHVRKVRERERKFPLKRKCPTQFEILRNVLKAGLPRVWRVHKQITSRPQRSKEFCPKILCCNLIVKRNQCTLSKTKAITILSLGFSLVIKSFLRLIWCECAELIAIQKWPNTIIPASQFDFSKCLLA